MTDLQKAQAELLAATKAYNYAMANKTPSAQVKNLRLKLQGAKAHYIYLQV